MSLLIPTLASGISVGLLFGLLGFSIVTMYKASATLSFAQPAIGMFTTFLAYYCWSKLGLAPVLAVILGLVAAAALGLLIYVVAMRFNDDAGPANRAFRTLAIYSLLLAIATAWFAEGQPFRFPVPLPHGHVNVGSGAIPWLSFVSLGVAIVLCCGLLFFFTRTRLGLMFRSVADDREVASMLGIRSRRITAAVWAASAVLACIVGLLTVPTAFVSTELLSSYAVYAMAGVFIGGLTSWTGTFLGGVIVGVISNLALVYMSNEAAIGFVFLALLLVLSFRPQGLLGTQAADRV
jgi:branched-chain amino acid transport system permease protein